MRQFIKDFLKFLRSSFAMVAFGLGFVIVLVLAAGLMWYLSQRPQGEDMVEQPVVEQTPMVEVLPTDAPVLLETELGLVPDGLPVEYTVALGDSSWRIAQAFYGCGENYVDIEAANSLSEDQMLEVGQTVVVPAAPVRCGQELTEVSPTPESTDQPEADDSSDPATEDQPQDDQTEETSETPANYTIVKGDTLWDIAEAQLGDPYLWTQLYQANRQVVGSNPDLIYPDTVLELPSEQVYTK